MLKKQYETEKVFKCLKKIVSCATCKQNIFALIAFLTTLPLFLYSDQIEIEIVGYQVKLFKGAEGHSIKDLIFKTVKGLSFKLMAKIVSDLSTIEIFYTALEQSLSDYLGLNWKSFHKYSVGNILTFQYEKGQSISKFIFEVLVNLISKSIIIFSYFFINHY